MASKKPNKPDKGGERPTPTSVRSVKDVLGNAKDTLAHAEHAFDDFMGDDASRQVYGLRNFIGSARSVTFVLQTMKNFVPDAEAWYQDVRERLKLDGVAEAFMQLRNQVEKEGVLPMIRKTGQLTYIRHLGPGSLDGIVPPGHGYVLGDARSGRNFWVDARGRRRYFDLPGHVGTSTGGDWWGADAPEALHSMSVVEGVQYYLELMEKVVAEAILKFGHLA